MLDTQAISSYTLRILNTEVKCRSSQRWSEADYYMETIYKLTRPDFTTHNGFRWEVDKLYRFHGGG